MVCKIAVQIFQTVSFCPNCGTRTENAGNSVNTAAQSSVPTAWFCPRVRRTGRAIAVCPTAPSLFMQTAMSLTVVWQKQMDSVFPVPVFLGAHLARINFVRKIGMGVLYIFTGGLFGIGAFVDLIVILCKPGPYYYV